MHILDHLFVVGEFAERSYLLSGLTLEQVTLRPDGASHSNNSPKLALKPRPAYAGSS